MTPTLPLSRPFDPSVIPGEGTHRRLAAELGERGALAAEFDLLELGALTADLTLTRWRGDGVEIHGRVQAELSQSCVVTLEPVAQKIDAPFVIRLVPAGSRLAEAAGREVAIDPSAEDPPDIYEGHTIDLGAIVTEQLGLAIDPYPRSPGAMLGEISYPPEAAEKPESPFGALASLAAKPKSRP